MACEDKLSLKYYLELGEKYKLGEGTQLLEWAEKRLGEAEAKEREKLERDVRSREREMEKLRLESENEREKLRLESEHEKEKLRLDAELKIKQLEVELVKSKVLNSEVSSTCVCNKGYIPRIKMTGLKGCKDSSDMEVVIDIFEREAKEIGLEDRYLCHEFRKVLVDRGVSAFLTELGAEENYKKLKEEVLKHFGLTESGYSNKFFQSFPDSDDRAGSYIRRTRHYLKRWIELSGTDRTYEGLFDLILRDKIVRTIGKDVREHILIHNPRSVEEVEKGCDIFFSIYPDKPLGNKEIAATHIATVADGREMAFRRQSQFSTERNNMRSAQYRNDDDDMHSSLSPYNELKERRRSLSPPNILRERQRSHSPSRNQGDRQRSNSPRFQRVGNNYKYGHNMCCDCVRNCHISPNRKQDSRLSNNGSHSVGRGETKRVSFRDNRNR